jgi:hypothetical protein
VFLSRRFGWWDFEFGELEQAVWRFPVFLFECKSARAEARLIAMAAMPDEM